MYFSYVAMRTKNLLLISNITHVPTLTLMTARNDTNTPFYGKNSYDKSSAITNTYTMIGQNSSWRFTTSDINGNEMYTGRMAITNQLHIRMRIQQGMVSKRVVSESKLQI